MLRHGIRSGHDRIRIRIVINLSMGSINDVTTTYQLPMNYPSVSSSYRYG
jgi:hypothetical protein